MMKMNFSLCVLVLLLGSSLAQVCPDRLTPVEFQQTLSRLPSCQIPGGGGGNLLQRSDADIAILVTRLLNYNGGQADSEYLNRFCRSLQNCKTEFLRSVGQFPSGMCSLATFVENVGKALCPVDRNLRVSVNEADIRLYNEARHACTMPSPFPTTETTCMSLPVRRNMNNAHRTIESESKRILSDAWCQLRYLRSLRQCNSVGFSNSVAALVAMAQTSRLSSLGITQFQDYMITEAKTTAYKTKRTNALVFGGWHTRVFGHSDVITCAQQNNVNLFVSPYMSIKLVRTTAQPSSYITEVLITFSDEWGRITATYRATPQDLPRAVRWKMQNNAESNSHQIDIKKDARGGVLIIHYAGGTSVYIRAQPLQGLSNQARSYFMAVRTPEIVYLNEASGATLFGCEFPVSRAPRQSPSITCNTQCGVNSNAVPTGVQSACQYDCAASGVAPEFYKSLADIEGVVTRSDNMLSELITKRTNFVREFESRKRSGNYGKASGFSAASELLPRYFHVTVTTLVFLAYTVIHVE